MFSYTDKQLGDAVRELKSVRDRLEDDFRSVGAGIGFAHVANPKTGEELEGLLHKATLSAVEECPEYASLVGSNVRAYVEHLVHEGFLREVLV